MEFKSNKVYVANIPSHIDSKALRVYFSCYGKVSEAVVIGNSRIERERNYGFVTFTQKTFVDHVLSVHHFISGEHVVVRRVDAVSSQKAMISYCEGDLKSLYLFICDIPKDANIETLMMYFSQFGNLKVAKLHICEGRQKNHLYLQYATIEAMVAARARKHRVPNLSSLNTTLVCKLGTLKAHTQAKLNLEAKDLLLHSYFNTRSKVNANSNRTKSSNTLFELVANARSKATVPFIDTYKHNEESNYRFNISANMPKLQKHLILIPKNAAQLNFSKEAAKS